MAAVGTALPETSIAIVAVVSGKATHEVGVGAILGAPMMLATLAMFVTGLAVIVFARSGVREIEMNVDHNVLGRDLRAFFLVYTVAIAAAFVPWYAGRVAIAVFLVVAYVRYVMRTFADENKMDHDHEMKPLHFRRKAEVPRLRFVTLQVVVGLILILIGAKLFVVAVVGVSAALHVPGLVLALIITPIATELPEKFNSVTWVKQKKDTFALGNISGAMVFQSSITPAIGILFTPWDLGKLCCPISPALASAVVAIVASVVAWGEMTYRKRLSPYTLLIGGAFYAAYLVYVL